MAILAEAPIPIPLHFPNLQRHHGADGDDNLTGFHVLISSLRPSPIISVSSLTGESATTTRHRRTNPHPCLLPQAWLVPGWITTASRQRRQGTGAHPIFSLTGSRSGTTHLRAHLDCCPARHAPIGPKQRKLILTKGEGGKANIENITFDQEKARRDLGLMICEHEYPLSTVQHSGFRRFCSSLQPLFKMVSRNTIRNDILAMYSAQRDKMVDFFATFKHRVAVTTDLWPAGYQKRGYMVVTAHYIDDSWNLKSYLMRFVYVPCPHSTEVICEALYECLVEWHVERKLSTVILDNCVSNDKAMVILPNKLDTSSLMLDGLLLHMRCATHILALIVKDGMSVLELEQGI